MENLRVTRVERVENASLWKNHRRQQAALRERLRQHNIEFAPIDTLDQHTSKSDANVNECWLWHGTTKEKVDHIAQIGFDPRLAHDGLYGDGSYFTDSFCKANQYAAKNKESEQEEYCALYCLVTMGAAYQTVERKDRSTIGKRPPINPATPDVPYDTVFAQSGKASGGEQVHSEFVIFLANHAYPAWIVWYSL